MLQQRCAQMDHFPGIIVELAGSGCWVWEMMMDAEKWAALAIDTSSE